MTPGLIGKKCGMTRIFADDGSSISVTVVAVFPNRIVQIKNKQNDGYDAIQVTTGTKKISKLNAPLTKHFAKAQVGSGEGLWEMRLAENGSGDFSVGSELTLELFKTGQLIDVSGISKGKGFAGVMKRHHFAGGFASHGCSVSHRVPGSIGQRQNPGRVFKGKKMAGHLGNVKRSIQNQRIVKIDSERNLIMIRGGIPGAPGGYVVLKPAVKQRRGGHGS
jgi:large subunit ribosomal protein L3